MTMTLLEMIIDLLEAHRNVRYDEFQSIYAMLVRARTLNVGQIHDVKFKFEHYGSRYMVSVLRDEDIEQFEIDRFSPELNKWVNLAVVTHKKSWKFVKTEWM